VTVTLPVDRTWEGTPVDDVAAVQLAACSDHDLVLRVLAPLAGDPPPDAPPGPTDRLWEHEVVELFVAGPDERYLELEVGPHGHHLVLRLEGVRRPVETRLPMELAVRRGEGAWAATARFPRAWLPAGPLRANAYRIHGPPDTRRHLAHAPVPGAQPDFHRLERFVPVDAPTAVRPRVDDLAALVAAASGLPRAATAPVVAALAAAGGAVDPDRLVLDALVRLRPRQPGSS
jgi:hypothetical protein